MAGTAKRLGSFCPSAATARRTGLVLALIMGHPLPLAADPVFSPQATEACLKTVEAGSAGRSGHAVLDCVGRAAQACMMTPGGDTTIGMIDCLGAETDYWDDRLNAAYTTRIADSRRTDEEIALYSSATASLEEALRDMQRAWIGYRDASCLYEQAQWQGGSGGGPATMACHMHETARQALKLEGWWPQ